MRGKDSREGKERKKKESTFHQLRVVSVQMCMCQLICVCVALFELIGVNTRMAIQSTRVQ